MGMFTNSALKYMQNYAETNREFWAFRHKTQMQRIGNNDETLVLKRNNERFHSMPWTQYSELISSADRRAGEQLGTTPRYFTLFHYLKDNRFPTSA